jgi:hypothetical protein
MNKYHYVYRITNKELNKHYYGVRSSKVEPKLDLGIKYFSSSRDKDFMNEQKINNSIFKYKVIKTFETREEAINLEIKLHSKFDVGINKSFYNRSKQTSNKFDTSGLKNTEEQRVKNSLRFKGTKLSEEHKNKIRQSLLGRKHTEETKEKMSKSLNGMKAWNKGVKCTDEQKEKIRNSTLGELHWNYGKTHSNETKEKMKKPKDIICCPYCLKTGGSSQMKRWHFENCKLKEKNERI